MTTNKALEQLQTEHQLILDAAGEGIYGLDGEGRITFSNAAATEILGWRIEDVRWRSRRPARIARRKIEPELRELIRRMAREKPLRGQRRIRAQLEWAT